MAFGLYTIFHKRQYDIRGVAFNQPLGNLMQIEKIWEEALSEFMGIFRHHDQMWRQRRRVFDSKILVLTILELVWQKENLGYKAILVRLWRLLKELGIKRLSGPISPSSLSEARQKLDPNIFVELNAVKV
jgi:hypothetical protein